jgi:LEA14-like dessication related protein
MKTLGVGLLALGMTACSVLGALAEKAGFSNPSVEVTGVQLQSFGLSGLTLGIYFQANNPNPIGLEVETLQYTVFFDGERIGEGQNERAIALPARGASSFSVTYSLSATEAFAAGLAALKGGEHQVEIKAHLGVTTPLGVLPLDVGHVETISF